jgi:hypothetical protein
MNSLANCPVNCYAVAVKEIKMSPVPEYLSSMIRRSTTTGCDIVENSTPVISFGNLGTAKIATLGINPSNIEFMKDAVFFTGDERRLATLLSLDAASTESLTDAQIQQVIDDCYGYFKRKPYKKWFDPLDKILNMGFNASYYDGSACHLDLVQWATNTKWKDLSRSVKEKLLKESEAHLINQLQAENVKKIVINGSDVWNTLEKLKLITFDEVQTIYFGKEGKRKTPCRLRIGQGCGATFYGWTSNIQSQPGANEKKFNEVLGLWLKEVGRNDHPENTH